MKSKTLASLTALVAVLAAAPAANAHHLPADIGIEVISVDPATRTVEAYQHCTTPPDNEGKPATFTVTRDIELNQFQPGVRWGIALAPDKTTILSTNDMPCDVPGGKGPGPGPMGPGGPDVPGGPGGDDQLPTFSRGFINHVWKFETELDSVEPNRLQVTMSKVLNLPKRFRKQDDELLDEAALVLFDSKARIYEGGKRVPATRLDDADGTIRVQGKLLAPKKWQEDEDGDPVPTIRARKIFL